jgi:hypothetical protein
VDNRFSIPICGQLFCFAKRLQFDVRSATKPRSLQTLILEFFLLRLFEILKPGYGVVSAPE